MRVLSVVGARPQFIKAAVVSNALQSAGVHEVMVHTGQHYDEGMSEVFFRELGLRAPDSNLAVGSGSHGDQTGRMLEGLERVMREVKPARALVYGDTNSTLAGALAAAKLGIPCDHVEAGLRSYDRDMPEEINRVVADHLCDQLFCPTRTAVRNLEHEGLTDGVELVGDVMLDLALLMRNRAGSSAIPDGLREGGYFVATVHRASNTDDPKRLAEVVGALEDVSREVAPVVLPVHPRLRARLVADSLRLTSVRAIDPVGYVPMQRLLMGARGVITDSGGVQKEALFHGVRCITLRDSTEWPETIDAGLNTLLGDGLSALREAASNCHGREAVSRTVLESFGGGHAGNRIAQLVCTAGNSRRRWRAPRS